MDSEPAKWKHSHIVNVDIKLLFVKSIGEYNPFIVLLFTPPTLNKRTYWAKQTNSICIRDDLEDGKSVSCCVSVSNACVFFFSFKYNLMSCGFFFFRWIHCESSNTKKSSASHELIMNENILLCRRAAVSRLLCIRAITFGIHYTNNNQLTNIFKQNRGARWKKIFRIGF